MSFGRTEKRPGVCRHTTEDTTARATRCLRAPRLGRNQRPGRRVANARDRPSSRSVKGIDRRRRRPDWVLGSIAEFERSRIRERITRDLAERRRKGQNDSGAGDSAAARRVEECDELSHADAAARLGVSGASMKRWRRRTHSTALQPPAA